MRVIPDATTKTLTDFVLDTCEPGSTVSNDGHAGYRLLGQLGYTHHIANQSSSTSPAHRVASLLKRWLRGGHQGGLQLQHLDYYLDEFTIRFNRRRASQRGLLSYRLLELAMQTKPTT